VAQARGDDRAEPRAFERERRHTQPDARAAEREAIDRATPPPARVVTPTPTPAPASPVATPAPPPPAELADPILAGGER
jgi:hypothetical protein